MITGLWIDPLTDHVAVQLDEENIIILDPHEHGDEVDVLDGRWQRFRAGSPLDER